MSRSWSISTYYEEGQPNDSEFPLILPRGSSLLLTWYTCFFDKAILFTDSGTFITHNGFLKIEEIRVVLVGIPPPASGSFTVTDAAFLETGILFLIEDRIYKRESTRELWQVGEAQNIPASGVQGLQSRTSCSTNNYPKLGVLVEACYVCDSTDKRLFLIIYNEETDTWIQSAFLAKLKPHSVPQGPFKMKFILSAWPSLLLWNDELMFYSYKNNSEYGNLHMSGSSNLTLLSGGSRIHQVILDDSWNVVVKMANNVFFYCKAGMDELIRLHNWEEKSTNMIFYLNNNGHLLVLKFNGSKLEPHRYPLDMEVKSSISTVCTYLTFQHSMNKPWYFIDKGEQLEFWALIIYPENMGINLQTFGYRLDLLQMKTRTQFEIAYQICSKNMTIAFHHERDYINAEKYTELISQTSGIATFEMVPNIPGNTCDLPADRVVHIHVGCNPIRNIRVHRPWGLPCKIMNFTNYTIPGSVLQIPTEQDLVVDYDWEKYGCLFNIYYTQPFLPSLDLYDGDVFLKSVDANFIIWEQHGRTDFSYNASMEEAYCLREAQTWKSMIAMSSNLSKKSIDEAWGPNNYRTCFEVTPGIFGDLGQPYEILNRSGKNFITWSQEQSGIYVFNVKILDPNFSFCDLRTVFTVQTYGVLTSDHSMLIATIEAIFTLVVLGILIYSYFRYVKIFNTMSVINPNPDEKDKQQ
ncbi:cation channel sperm-associated protein subunit epsilon-like [Acipenser oxyrinchus oxyrinchus]|uniref:Cation channel sperm-associated protein subunit epsilon-like n=1 Tax=Acipenser oxyrinchus oxyrinchus TaxID=40147 RepID=A0AAD8GAB8_ACIOX|nr:cation channel sperm-associated protein subunit epsilon-like [Acipenser oxyrinchus oxyrinchus]